MAPWLDRVETDRLQHFPEMPWSSAPAVGLLGCCSTSGAEAESGGFVQPGKGKAAKGTLTAAGSCGFGEKLKPGSPGKCPETG